MTRYINLNPLKLHQHNKEGMSLKEISLKYGVAPRTISKKIKEAGYEVIVRYNISENQKKDISNTLKRKYSEGILVAPWTGKKLPLDMIKKISESKKGKESPLKGKPRFDLRGKNHPRWKGGKYRSEEQKLRHSIEWKNMREEVFKRDNYTCQSCGKRGCELHPHHVIQKSKRPDLTFDINNVITLCVQCHIKPGMHGGK